MGEWKKSLLENIDGVPDKTFQGFLGKTGQLTGL